MISVQQLLSETRIFADYSDTVAAAVAPGPGRAVYIPPRTRDLQPLESVPRSKLVGSPRYNSLSCYAGLSQRSMVFTIF